MVYKVSYVEVNSKFPGAIISEFERPEIGQRIQIGDNVFEIIEINDLMPPRGDFAFLHATVKFLNSAAEDGS